jgi:hypothetical protein
MSTITLFTEMHTTNHVNDHVLLVYVPVDILSTVRWMLAWSSCSVCVDDLNTQYPWDASIKRSLWGLSPVIVEAIIALKLGVQETQTPSKPWVSWLFEHPVWSLAEISHPSRVFIVEHCLTPCLTRQTCCVREIFEFPVSDKFTVFE